MIKVTIIAARSMGRTGTKSTCFRPFTKLFSSTRAVLKKQQQQQQQPKSLYCWGTSNKGTIPTQEVLESGRSSDDGEAIVNLDRFKSGLVIGSPTEINVQAAFGSRCPLHS